MNKAEYTATPVACGWAGAIFEVTRPFGQEQWGQRIKIIKKVKCDGPTDQPTDRPTDKAGCRVACTRLKIGLMCNLLHLFRLYRYVGPVILILFKPTLQLYIFPPLPLPSYYRIRQHHQKWNRDAESRWSLSESSATRAWTWGLFRRLWQFWLLGFPR